MNRPPIAWVLNLDAEHELEVGTHYAPTRHLREIVARESRRLLGSLVGPGDVVVTEETVRAAGRRAREIARGLVGLAWSPTPRALALLEAAGAQIPRGPSLDTLRQVNARPFAAGVRSQQVDGSFDKWVATHRDEALRLLARAAPDGWLVRRTFGAAGRGRRRIAAGRPSQAELQWLDASLKRGPLVIEPWVKVLVEYTRSGWVSPEGEVYVSPPCFQETTAAGAWTRTETAGRHEVARDDDEQLGAMVQRVGEALAREGYAGPFGIDAFRHAHLGKAGSVLNPLSEINARFTMDWRESMASVLERGSLRITEVGAQADSAIRRDP